jgi:hypothetical protein
LDKQIVLISPLEEIPAFQKVNRGNYDGFVARNQ